MLEMLELGTAQGRKLQIQSRAGTGVGTVTCVVGNKAGETGLSEDIGAQTVLPSPARGARHKIVRFGGVCPAGFQSFFFFFFWLNLLLLCLWPSL